MKTYVYKLELIERLWNMNQWTKEDEMMIEKHFLR